MKKLILAITLVTALASPALAWTHRACNYTNNLVAADLANCTVKVNGRDALQGQDHQCGVRISGDGREYDATTGKTKIVVAFEHCPDNSFCAGGFLYRATVNGRDLGVMQDKSDAAIVHFTSRNLDLRLSGFMICVSDDQDAEQLIERWTDLYGPERDFIEHELNKRGCVHNDKQEWSCPG